MLLKNVGNGIYYDKDSGTTFSSGSSHVQQWLADGGIPEPEFTEAELQATVKAEITSAIQSMLDTQAQSLRYDNMMSARSYAGFANPFQVEAQALSVWCANCWITAGQLEALGTVTTVEEVMAQMPKYVA